ncbi:MAG: methyltransferase domain-containing protein [Candidatus Heimdallarchaeota archaeon]|nr:methyltransferase domain-containing protein [Candidatus Heimdallarchaeota archaeon]MCK4768881.1 methyltransferase domain-containing protein [Candidatus Heimdallarchaeota archaeon]
MSSPHWIRAYENLALIYDEIAERIPEIKKKKEERTIREIVAIKQIVEKRGFEINNSTLLDIGGGTGRLALPLSKLVKRIILAEPSKSMLDIAKGKLETVKDGKFDFLQEGFLELSLNDNTVDIAISFNDPFQYLLTLEEQIKALENIKRILKQNGIIILENSNFFSLLLREEWPKPTSWETEKHKVSRFIHYDVQAFKNVWNHIENIFVEDLKTGKIEHFESIHRLKNISATELILLAQKVGFENIRLYPGTDLDAEEGTRFLLVAQKP